MASPKRGKKTPKRSGRAADPAAVEAAAAALAEGAAISGGTSLPTLGGPELEALVQRLLEARDPDALARLAEQVTDKAQSRAVKRALYTLSQKGLTPAGASAGAPGAVASSSRGRAGGGSGELPILMSAPGPDARRIFTWLVEDRPQPFVVEAYFCVPEGLFRLQSSPTTRADYLPWAQQLLVSRDPDDMGLPARVDIDRAVLQRKLWEIGLHLSEHTTGAEVDLALARKLALRRSPPRHPAQEVTLGGGQVLDVVALAARPYRLRSLVHTLPMLELRRQWRELGGAGLVSSTAGATGIGAAVGEWALQWGYDLVEELLLDLTSFLHVVGDLDAAATFQHLATLPAGGARREGIDRFLRDFVVHYLSTHPA